MVKNIQKNIIDFIQKDLPVCENPYKVIAEKLKITPQQVVQEIVRLKKEKILRRYGAILNHKKIGLKVNCMCLWQVEKKKVKKIADIAKTKKQISHCYLRKTASDWPYNFYTMIHAATRDECLALIQEISKKSKVKTYKMLFTQKELKKTGAQYKIT